MFGNPETTPGGRALKFYSSVRIDIRRIETLKKGVDIYGIISKVKIVKNKVAPPFRFTELEIRFGKGISYEADLIDLAAEFDIIEKSGTWFSYEGARMGQGKDNAKKYLIENPEIAKEIEKKVKDKVNNTSDNSENSPEEKAKEIVKK